MDLLREYVKSVLLENKQFDMSVFRKLSLEDAHEYLKRHAKYLGQGISRKVYDTGLGYVIKISPEDINAEFQPIKTN